MKKIFPTLKIASILLILLFGYCLLNYRDFSIYMNIGYIIAEIVCLYELGESYSYNSEILEKKIFWKKQKLELSNITKIRGTLYLGSYAIRSNQKGFYSFWIDFSFQNKTRDDFIEKVKKANPECIINL